MNKKIIFSAIVLMFSMHSFAQENITSDVSPLDFEEDTINVTSLDDIIKTQNMTYNKNFRANVVQSVWKRKNAFTIAFATANLEGKDMLMYDQEDNDYKKRDQTFSSDWGVNVKFVNTGRFHKRPIADVLSFGLDYSLLDVQVNHYKSIGDADKPLYRSDKKHTEKVGEESKEYHNVPWGLEMYQFTYGINLGPSIDVAPFTHLKSPSLAHVRLHLYFNVGYRASLLLLNGDKDQNFCKKLTSNTNVNYEYNNEVNQVNEASKLQWGHGLYTLWGIRLSWKGLGIGYEMTNGSQQCKSVNTDTFGSDTQKLSQLSHRIALSYIW